MNAEYVKAALDTNILVYAESFGDTRRCDKARNLIARLPQQSVIIPAQALGELMAVLIRKAHRPALMARSAALG